MSNPQQFFSGVVGGVVGFFASGGNPLGAIYGPQLGLAAGIVDDVELAERFARNAGELSVGAPK